MLLNKRQFAEKLAKKLIKKNINLLAGDVIKVQRTGYWHVGVYIGNDEVIHFSSLHSDTSSSDNKIIKTSLLQFLRNQKRYEKVKFPLPDAPPASSKEDPLEYFFKDYLFHNPDYKLYPAHQVVERAKSRLGEGNYDLISNNCEHFAIWCKTGISHSKQIELLKSYLFKN